MGRTKIHERQVIDSEFLSEQELEDKKGVSNGIAPLDENTKIPCEYLYTDCLVQTTNNYIRSTILEDLNNLASLYLGEIIYIKDKDIFAYSKEENSTVWYTLYGHRIIRSDLAGTGDIGIWYENFANTIDTNKWYGDLGDLDNGTEAGKWNRHEGSTPSRRTGANSSSDNLPGYIYVETSSNGYLASPRLKTTNFAVLQSLSFKLYLYGNNCGTFNVIANNSENGEVLMYSISGNQGSEWITISIDTANYKPEEIIFEYTDATGWQGDCCLDEIIFESIG